VNEERLFLSMPYARPKVGRRASDQQLLDDWYARLPRHGVAREVDRVDDLAPARLYWREPAEAPSARVRR
jgi:hypothetical protein